jgi:hypothetical protein
MIKCEFENGSAAGLRHVTVDGIIMRYNQVLLSKRDSYNGKPININECIPRATIII